MRLTVLTFLLAATLLASGAATPPAAQLLPADTLAFFSVPDWDKAVAYWEVSPPGKLWQDPALKAFKAKVGENWKEELVKPIERRWGIQLTELLDLVHGQVTFAITQGEWGSKPGASVGLLLLVDTKDKQEALKTRLATLRSKWIEAGKQLKPLRIRDLDFTTFLVPPPEAPDSPARKAPLADPADDDDDADDGDDEAAAAEAREITVGQSDAVLIVSNHPNDIERLLARQAGSMAPPLAEQAAYDANQGLFRDALGMGWIHFARVYETFTKKTGNKGSKNAAPFALNTERLLTVSGLAGVRAIAGRVAGSPEGFSAEVFVNVPESRRQGLFRLLTADRKDTAPPDYVPADVLRFRRWRVDGPKAWATVETMLTAVSPEIAGLLQMGLQAAGKDRDPNFDLRRTLIGNLGDDFVWMQRTVRPATGGDLNAPPSLVLIGSPKSEDLVQGMKVATALMPLAGGEPTLKEQEFLGRRVFSLALPPLPSWDNGKKTATARSFNFAAGGGYAAMSTDISMLQEYLRQGEAPGKPLRQLPGLVDAAQKVGGMNGGLFGFENQVETMRAWFENTKQQGAAVDKLLAMAGSKGLSAEERASMKGSFDASLLPPFDQISKYFHFVVYSLSTSSEGLTFKFFAPAPPALR